MNMDDLYTWIYLSEMVMFQFANLGSLDPGKLCAQHIQKVVAFRVGQ